MANWNNYSLGSQVPFGAVNPSMVNRTEVPAATSSTGAPFDIAKLLSPLFMFSQIGKGQFGRNGVFGGLLGGGSSPFGNNQTTTTAVPKKTVIDQRPADIQSLVSMFSNGGMK